MFPIRELLGGTASLAYLAQVNLPADGVTGDLKSLGSFGLVICVLIWLIKEGRKDLRETTTEFKEAMQEMTEKSNLVMAANTAASMELAICVKKFDDKLDGVAGLRQVEDRLASLESAGQGGEQAPRVLHQRK